MVISMEPMESLRYLPYLAKTGTIVTSSKPFINIPNYPDEAALQAELDALPSVVKLDIETVAKDEEHTVAADEAILAGCTMDITAFQEAIVKACNDEFAKSFKASSPKLGLGVVTEVDSSCASATADADGAANMYTHFAAVAVDEDGKILADLIDAIQPKIAFNTAGEETDYNFVDTKKYLKYDYNMVAYGNSVGEWFEETKVFEDYIVGKDAAGVTGIATVVNEEGHSVATDADADLLAGCTISISTFQEAVAKACNNAR